MSKTLFLLSFASLIVFSQGCIITKKAIVGSVVSSEGKVLKQANVTTEPPTESVLTDSYGRFIIRGIPAGKYSIRANKKGYSEAGVSVSVSGENVIQADIQLEKDSSDNTIY